MIKRATSAIGKMNEFPEKKNSEISINAMKLFGLEMTPLFRHFPEARRPLKENGPNEVEWNSTFAPFPIAVLVDDVNSVKQMTK